LLREDLSLLPEHTQRLRLKNLALTTKTLDLGQRST
jgi:hypothetical protein